MRMLTDAAQRKYATQVIDAVADPDVQRYELGYVGMYAAHNLTSQDHLARLDLLFDTVHRVFREEGPSILGTVPLSPGRLVGSRSASPMEKAGLQLARITGDVRLTSDDLTIVARLIVAMAPSEEIVERLHEAHQAVHAELERLRDSSHN
jgi:hypothetical protein